MGTNTSIRTIVTYRKRLGVPSSKGGGKKSLKCLQEEINQTGALYVSLRWRGGETLICPRKRGKKSSFNWGKQSFQGRKPGDTYSHFEGGSFRGWKGEAFPITSPGRGGREDFLITSENVLLKA